MSEQFVVVDVGLSAAWRQARRCTPRRMEPSPQSPLVALRCGALRCTLGPRHTRRLSEVPPRRVALIRTEPNKGVSPTHLHGSYVFVGRLNAAIDAAVRRVKPRRPTYISTRRTGVRPQQGRIFTEQHNKGVSPVLLQG